MMIKQKKYKLFVMDVDGTMTDGKIYMSVEGEVYKTFNVKDGYGIKELLPGIEMKAVVITGRKSEIVQKRADELNITVLYQGIKDKVKCLEEITEAEGVSWDEIVYVGDDLNDIECMRKAGLACCPQDACNQVKNVAGYVSDYRGGDGAVRQIIDRLVDACSKDIL